MLKHGKGEYIQFDDEALLQLRQYFNSLDDDASGAIGVDELEDPLIALGLVENRQQVEQIIREVDDDDTGEIEFPEFLKIMKNGGKSNKDEKSGAIYQFFKDLTDGKYKVGKQDIPFQLFITRFRREKLLDSMM